ncbi:MAG: hypothetical protein AB7O57_15540 [Hyphomicrobiaceae bacterium]
MLKLLKSHFAPESRGTRALQRIVEKTGIAVRYDDEWQIFRNAYLQPILAEAGKRGFAALQEAYEAEHEAKLTNPWGGRYYEMIEGSLDLVVPSDSPDPILCEERLAEVQTAWEEGGRTPFLSAAFARLAANCGHAWRGGDWAGNVSEKGWQKLAEYTDLAREVMEMSDPGPGACPFWHSINFSLCLTDDSDPDEKEARFERYAALDPLSPDVYTARAYQLLPRWHGSFEEIEQMARDAVHRTAGQRGLEMYGRIYALVSHYDPIGMTDCDLADLTKGYVDWTERWPTQCNVNRLARFAWDMQSMPLLRHVLESRLTEVHMSHWEDAAMVAAAWRQSGAKLMPRR